MLADEADNPGRREDRSRDVRGVNVRLELGEIDTVVEVTAGATLIETETPRISDSKTADILKSLPINTRSLWNFMSLSPTVVGSPLGAYRRFAGSRLNQSDAAIDGITTSNMFDGTQISPLVSYIESYQEVRVDMANNTAEYGSVGMVNIISKGAPTNFTGRFSTTGPCGSITAPRRRRSSSGATPGTAPTTGRLKATCPP